MDATDVPDGATIAVSGLKGWIASPFNSQMDLTHWFLFTGLILCGVILWTLILRETLGEI